MSRTLQPVRTRLSDLAVQAGVSTATVSRVLNGKAGVSGETRQAVLAALDLLGLEQGEVADRDPVAVERGDGSRAAA